MSRTRIIIVDGVEIHTSLSAIEIADLEQKNKELINKIKFNEKSRRKMQQSLMKQIDDLEQQCKKQKKVIDKAIELNQIINNSDYVYSQDEITIKNLDILKEVSE